MNDRVIYTTDYIYNLPDGQRAELIDGQIYAMSPPSFRHQKIVVELSTIINNYIKGNNGLCEVLPAPFAVFLNQDDKNYVEPDISVICDKNKLDERGCNGAPDWIIEVVSPGSKRMDYFIKLFKYRTADLFTSLNRFECGFTAPNGYAFDGWLFDANNGVGELNLVSIETLKGYESNERKFNFSVCVGFLFSNSFLKFWIS